MEDSKKTKENFLRKIEGGRSRTKAKDEIIKFLEEILKGIKEGDEEFAGYDSIILILADYSSHEIDAKDMLMMSRNMCATDVIASLEISKTNLILQY